MKKIFSILSILVMILVAGCGAENAAVKPENNFCTVTDDSGREITLAEKPVRVVTVSTSFLEPLHEVGLDVVGRPNSKYEIPEYAKNAAEIGAVFQIDTEKLLACQPDLVIINKGMNERLGDLLTTNKINFFVADMKGYDSVKKNIEAFAQMAGQPEKGTQIISDMDKKISAVVEKLPNDKKRVAILHSTAQGLSVQLDNSIAGNVVKILGWENVASGMQATKDGGDTAPYSLETLVEQNPEIIFVTSMGKLDEIKANVEKLIAENPAWQTIPAIQNKQFYFLPQDLFLLSPGINYPAAVEYAAKLIYPEVEF